jgi:hypothetical protein
VEGFTSGAESLGFPFDLPMSAEPLEESEPSIFTLNDTSPDLLATIFEIAATI